MRKILHISIIIFLLIGTTDIFSQDNPDWIKPAIQEKNRQNQRLGIQYYQTRDFEKALEIFSSLYPKDPSHVNYTYYLYALLELREYKEAEKLTKKQVKAHPGQLQYQVDVGYIYIRSSETEKGNKVFNNVINDLPANINVIKQVANTFYSRSQTEYAIKAYKRGKELMKGEYTFDIELANMYERNGNYTEMVETFLDHLEEYPEARENVQNRLQTAMTRDIDNALPDILRESLLVRYQKDPDEVYLNELLLWLSIQQKDFSFAFVQARSLDRRFSEDGYRVYEVAEMALSNNDFAAALESYQYILDKGVESPMYLSGLIGFLETRYQQISNNIRIEEKEMMELENSYNEALEEFGIHQRTIQLLRDLAHIQAFHLNKETEAINNLLMAIEVPGPENIPRAQCKLELADIYLFQGEVWEATLLYSQVEKTYKNEPIGHMAKLKNARLTYYIGEFAWAKAQLDVLKSATSKLIANDALELSLLIADNTEADSSYAGLFLYSQAELLIYQNRYDEAFIKLDAITILEAWHPLLDEVLFKKSEIRIKQGRYEEADTLLMNLCTRYPDDILGDDALYTRARLHEEIFKDEQMAMNLYQQLLTNYPGSIYTIDTRKRFRYLRGDTDEPILEEDRFFENPGP